MGRRPVWGIEIGETAVRALCLAPGGSDGTVEPLAHDRQPIVAEDPDDRSPFERAAPAVEELAVRRRIGKSRCIVVIPARLAFAHAFDLEDADDGLVDSAIAREAARRIPFPIDEVHWSAHRIAGHTGNGGIEHADQVALFALPRVKVIEILEPLAAFGLHVAGLQLSSVALHNALVADRFTQFAGGELGPTRSASCAALLRLDSTTCDLILTDGELHWSRVVPVGNDRLLSSAAEQLEIGVPEVERLWRTPSDFSETQKLATALRPAYEGLVSEIQRSFGAFMAHEHDRPIGKLVCLGSGFRLPGLMSFLKQQLGRETGRVARLRRARPGTFCDSREFAAALDGYFAAYGGALQGLGLAPIGVNLLYRRPSEAARHGSPRRGVKLKLPFRRGH